LLELRNRGVILAIASKNNAADVEEAMATNMAMVVQPEHFAAREIHWEPKSVSLARIAESLNIGLEHIVFVDDNPAECAEVQLAHPSVTAITLPSAPEQFVDAVLCDGFFDSLSYSAEDAARAKLYEQRNAAESLRESAASLEDYLSSLSMTVILGPVSNASVARASQMTQKTNQFNTTTRRYSESEIAVRMQRDDWITLTARVSDRFGDNGIVLLAMAECQGDVFEIDTFLMSCRVIGRTVETAVLHRLCEAAAAAGASAIRGDIFVTPRNTPVRDMFARHGFEKIAERGENSTWQLQLPASLTIPEWLEVIDENG
jgi:FkbH-like protein